MLASFEILPLSMAVRELKAFSASFHQKLHNLIVTHKLATKLHLMLSPAAPKLRIKGTEREIELWLLVVSKNLIIVD